MKINLHLFSPLYFPPLFSFLYPFSLIYPSVLYLLIFFKCGASGSDRNHLNPGFCHLLAVWLWGKDLAALTSNFFIYKMRLIRDPLNIIVRN